jgi:hypothetical protein
MTTSSCPSAYREIETKSLSQAFNALLELALEKSTELSLSLNNAHDINLDLNIFQDNFNPGRVQTIHQRILTHIPNGEYIWVTYSITRYPKECEIPSHFTRYTNRVKYYEITNNNVVPTLKPEYVIN